MAVRRWLADHIREVSESFGYQEYDGPFLERLELYAARSGEELVKEQSFVFPDRGGDMIVLRPELTPSLARMVAARIQALPRPIRWWSFGPFWRYENPQKGRGREFFQWNIDLIGDESPLADAEIASVAAAFLHSVGLGSDAVRLYVNDRRLAEKNLDRLGVDPDRRPEVLRLIDRKDRMPAARWHAYAAELGYDPDLIRELERMLDDRDLARESDDLNRFFEAAKALDADDYLAYDPSVVRGLDYYTGIVFEARDREREFRAILGGGRYDELVSAVGGDPVPATGFAMGDMVIPLVLERYGAMPELSASRAQLLVLTFDEASVQPSLELAAALRADGLRVEWYPRPDKLAKQLKYADRMQLPLAVILGPDELAAGLVTIKDLRSGNQEQVQRERVADRVHALLAQPAG